MKKLLLGFLALVLILVAAVFIVPGMINWNDYKGQIAAQAKSATGRTLSIDGDISISVLPSPALLVHDVRLSNLKGATSPDMIRLKTLQVQIALGPLFGGQVQVQSVKLIEPVIDLEVLADGRRNWDIKPPKVGQSAAGDKTTPKNGSSGPESKAATPDIRLDKFLIEKGRLVYRDGSGKIERLDKINARVAAVSLDGPIESAGSFITKGMPLRYELSIGKVDTIRATPVSASLGSVDGDALINVSGAIVGLSETPKFKGKIKGNGKNLSALAGSLTGNPLPSLFAQPFGVEGEVVATEKGAEVGDLTLSLGDAHAKGSVSVTLGEKIKAASKLKVSRIDLDQWMALASGQSKKPEQTAKTSAAGSSGASVAVPPAVRSAAGKSKPPAAFSLPGDIEASLDLLIDSISYKDGLISQLRLNTELANSEITISQLSAQYPGSSDLAFFGFISAKDGKPYFEGELDTMASDFRSVLRWLDIDIPDVPANRLRKLSINGKISGNPEQIQIADLSLLFDSSKVNGGITIALRDRPSFGASLTLDRLNVNAYLPKSKSGRKAGTAPAKADGKQTKPGKKNSAPNPFAALSALKSFDANIKARAKTLIYEGSSIRDVVFDGTLYNGVLTLRNAGIKNLAGSSVKLTGSLSAQATIPEAKNLILEAHSKNIARLMDILGSNAPIDAARVGTVRLNASVNGSLLKPAINVNLKGAGGEYGFTGGAVVLPLIGSLNGTLTAKHGNLIGLLRAVGVDYRPAGRIGGLSLKTGVKATLSSVELNNLAAKVGSTRIDGTVGVVLSGGRPRIKATLKTGTLKIDQFLPVDRTALLRRLLPQWRHALERPPVTRPTAVPVVFGAPKGRNVSGYPSWRLLAASPQGRGRWPTDPIDLSALADFDGDVTLASDALVFGNYTVRKVQVVSALKNAVLSVPKLQGVLFGGGLNGTVNLNAVRTPVIDAAITLKNAEVANALREITGQAPASGKMVFDLKTKTSGRSVADMIAGLGGNGTFALQNLDVKGGAKGSALAGVLDLIIGLNQFGGALGGGKNSKGTAANVTGSFAIDKGVVSSQDIKLTSNVGSGQATGSVDLPGWQMDVSGNVDVAQNLLTGILAQQLGAPSKVPFRVHGVLDAPNVKLDTGKMQGGGMAIPGLDKLMKKKGIGGILQQIIPGVIGGSSPGSTAQPAPLPPKTSSGNGQMAPPPPPSGQQQQQQQQQQQKIRPEDLFKNLLKGLGR